jgi:uncharacterized protein (DUF1015 family)
VPVLRPFRALRFDVSSVDLAGVLAPPYDVITPAQRALLLDRDPHNAVRIDLPAEVGAGDADAYRTAARTVAAWRTDRILVKDRQPTLTVHQMTWRDGRRPPRSCVGLFARLRIEPYAPGSGVLPHERTMSGPKEDRYRLLKATGLNTSPIVVLAGSDPGTTSAALEALSAGPADIEVQAGDGVVHRLWIHAVPDPGLPGDLDPRPGRDPGTTSTARSNARPQGGSDGPALRLLDLIASAPVTIADGHHRYETALRYREERGANRACESDPPWDYVMALVYPVDRSPAALPTHRVLRGRPCGAELVERLRAYGTLEPLAGRVDLLARMAEPGRLTAGGTGTGRIGVLTGDHAVLLHLEPAASDGLLDEGLSDASRGLDVNALAAIIGRVYGEEPGELAGGGRLWFEKEADEATAQVEAEAASACFLLDAMPSAAVAMVARAGEVMPHKSTYFDPKAPTGLLFSPMEW